MMTPNTVRKRRPAPSVASASAKQSASFAIATPVPSAAARSAGSGRPFSVGLGGDSVPPRRRAVGADDRALDLRSAQVDAPEPRAGAIRHVPIMPRLALRRGSR
jgi:hypothetical protein